MLGRLLGREERATLGEPGTDLVEALSGAPAYSGRSVNVDGSLRLVPVYSAVSLLAGTVGSLPMKVYRRLDDGREPARKHWMWRLLHDRPNPEMAADEFFELLMTHLLLWGNAFAWKVKNPAGRLIELWLIRPSRVQVYRDDRGDRRFVIDGTPGYTEQDVLHIRGLGTDGLVGLSPVQQHRQMLAGAMEIEEYTGRFYANNATPPLAIKHPNRLSQDAVRNLRDSWTRTYGGARNSGKPAILEEGMDIVHLGLPLDDAQFIETQQFNDLRVAQMFRIPPSMLGAKSGDSLTYATTELQGIEFVTYSLRRWLVRIEGSLARDGAMFLQGDRFYPEFLVDALLRSSTKDRYEAYQIGIQSGFLGVDEVRERENLQPRGEVVDGEVVGELSPADVVPLLNRKQGGLS